MKKKNRLRNILFLLIFLTDPLSIGLSEEKTKLSIKKVRLSSEQAKNFQKAYRKNAKEIEFYYLAHPFSKKRGIMYNKITTNDDNLAEIVEGWGVRKNNGIITKRAKNPLFYYILNKEYSEANLFEKVFYIKYLDYNEDGYNGNESKFSEEFVFPNDNFYKLKNKNLKDPTKII